MLSVTVTITVITSAARFFFKDRSFMKHLKRNYQFESANLKNNIMSKIKHAFSLFCYVTDYALSCRNKVYTTPRRAYKSKMLLTN